MPDVNGLPQLDRGAVVTVGTFDGVHRGHRDILRRVAEQGERLGLPSLLVTFAPHPLRVVNPKAAPPLLVGNDYHPVMAESSHLISGGADEKLVTLAVNGHIKVNPPGPGNPSDEGTHFVRAQLEIKEHSTPAPEAQPYLMALRK